MTTTEERKRLRDEKVLAALSAQPKPPKRKAKRKRGIRPPDAKMMPALPEPEKAEELPESTEE